VQYLKKRDAGNAERKLGGKAEAMPHKAKYGHL
jgi:hypothetical protein